MTASQYDINESSFFFKDLPLLEENSFVMNLRRSSNQFEDNNEKFGLQEDGPTFEMNSDINDNSIDRVASGQDDDVAKYLKEFPNQFDDQ